MYYEYILDKTVIYVVETIMLVYFTKSVATGKGEMGLIKNEICSILTVCGCSIFACRLETEFILTFTHVCLYAAINIHPYNTPDGWTMKQDT